MYGNQLESLPDELGMGCRELTKIEAWHNRLSSLPVRALLACLLALVVHMQV